MRGHRALRPGVALYLLMAACGLMAPPLADAQARIVERAGRGQADGESTGAAAAERGMSMVTFNLQHDRADWPRRRRTIAAELERLQPDAIALQEVIERTDLRNQAEWLAERLGYSYQFVSTDPEGAVKRYGNALLTRRPVIARGQHLLQPLTDYRTVAHLRIDVAGRPVNVYATHLHERSDEAGQRLRRTQVEDLLKYIAATSADAPVVIAGDFNALVDAGDLSALRSRYGDSYGSVHVNNDLAAVSTLNRHYFQTPSRIDHIFFQQDEMIAREARLLFDQPDGEGHWASDHYGVWVRLQFAPET